MQPEPAQTLLANTTLDDKRTANANQNDTKIVSPFLQIIHLYANICLWSWLTILDSWFWGSCEMYPLIWPWEREGERGRERKGERGREKERERERERARARENISIPYRLCFIFIWIRIDMYLCMRTCVCTECIVNDLCCCLCCKCTTLSYLALIKSSLVVLFSFPYHQGIS